MLNLRELNPSWRADRHAGVEFDCPTHRTHRLWIYFGFMWRPSGAGDLENLSVTPAIDARECGHFTIVNGHVVMVVHEGGVS